MPRTGPAPGGWGGGRAFDPGGRGPATGRMTVWVQQRSSAEIARRSRAAVAREAANLASWQSGGGRDRGLLLAVVRASLLRLLENPSWVPLSARLDGNRVEVNLVIELDDTQLAAAADVFQLGTDVLEARSQLLALVERLSGAKTPERVERLSLEP